MGLAAGTMRERLTVERLREQAVSAFGEQRQTPDRWYALRSLWGSVQAFSAREVLQSDRTQTMMTYIVRIRRMPELTTRDRFRWRGGILNIQSIQLRGVRKEEMEILCGQEVD